LYLLFIAKIIQNSLHSKKYFAKIYNKAQAISFLMYREETFRMQTPLCELDNRVITKQKVYAYEELFYPKADNEAERKDFATYQADCLHI
jgi:hypothetical protein